MVIALIVALAGCGSEAEQSEPEPSTSAIAPEPRPDRAGAPSEPPPLRPPRCPSDAANCETASGTILALERVDPDGDGDAHFILLSRQSITAPGISVIDVAPALRPDPLPGPGDQVAAAGPVFRGSYGQRQIQATALRIRRE